MHERDIFTAAREMTDPATRAAFLAGACANDPALRDRVERLLRADDHPDSLLDRPAVTPPYPDPENTSSFAPGRTADTPTGRDTGDADFPYLDASDRPDTLGRLGHYEVVEVLGRGGFGTVFRAIDEVLGREVAVKVLASDVATTPPGRKRFIREARASAAIRHENVVQTYAVEESPRPYLVMEFIPGETLQQRLDRLGVLPVAEVVRIGRQIAEGLAAAHATGVIQGDVKPSNVLIEDGPRERVKLTDFGLAQAVDDAGTSRLGQVAGTPQYMSPEQARGERLDHRADLFSLGSMLYVLACGRLPFRAEHTLAVMKRVIDDTPRSPRETNSSVPPWLCDLIAKLHAKNPADRFQSAQEVAELLGRGPGGLPDEPPVVVGHAPPSATAETAVYPPPARGFVRGRRSVLLGSVVLALVGLGLAEAVGLTGVRGAVVRLLTPDATLVIEVDDPGVSVTLDGEDVVITGTGVKELRVKPGEYKVLARKDGKVVRQELVTVTANGRRVVRISVEPPPVVPAAPAPSRPDPSPAHSNADRRAVVWLRSLGPTSITVETEPGSPFLLRPNDPFPPDPFRVTAVAFRGTPFEEWGDDLADQIADHMSGVRLDEVHLKGNRFTTAGLAKLVRLPEIAGVTRLTLLVTEVDDDGFAHLAKLRRLHWLDLNGCPRVTGKGLHALEACPGLASLTLYNSSVSPDGVKELQRLLALEYLNLSFSPLDEQHTAALAKLNNVATLYAHDCGIDDRAATELAGLGTLVDVNIFNNRVTDVGLAKFKRHERLALIGVGGCPVTPAGVADFREARPDCEVVLEWPDR